MELQNSPAHTSTVNNSLMHTLNYYQFERLIVRAVGGITINNLPFSEISGLVYLANILPLCTKEVNESDPTLSIQL